MLKTIAAIALAATIAGAITGFPLVVEPVAAGPAVDAPAIAAPGCPERGWPYRHCGGDRTGLNGVRLVTTDRLR